MARNNKSVWNVDNAHSKISFSARHMVIAEVTGQFKDFNVTLNGFEDDITQSKVYVEINAASIDTGNEDRDKHLRSDDFLGAESYPKIVFEGDQWEKISEDRYKVRGNLTIREKTSDFTFEVTYGGKVKDPYGLTRSGYRAEGKLNRFDYNLRWNNLLETGGAVVGKEIKLTADIELVKKEEQAS